MMHVDEVDPRGLIRESYAIEGISAAECRSIFMDWAIFLSSAIEVREAIRVLLATYADQPPDHPMTVVLTAGLHDGPAPRRRGGRAARLERH